MSRSAMPAAASTLTFKTKACDSSPRSDRLSKKGQGSALDPLGPEAPDPISAARLFLASWAKPAKFVDFLASPFPI